MRAIGVLGLAAALACSSSEPEPAPVPSLPLGPVCTLPSDWATMNLRAFEDWVQRAFPEELATPLARPSVRELAAALEATDTPEALQASVRAALILGRSRTFATASVLIRRLERRVLGPQRHSDCADCLAAAALARFPAPALYARRLVPLAVGRRPHPDLEVRVECAATALHAGYEQVIPFLLQVLRIDTFEGQGDQRDFAVSPTTAWARGRAAEALSTFAGIPLSYQTDGPIAHREREAEKLEELLLPDQEQARPEEPAPPAEAAMVPSRGSERPGNGERLPGDP